MRFEEPSSMVRWDSPLVTVPWIDEELPGKDIWKAAMEGIVKPPNAGTSAVSSFFNFLMVLTSDFLFSGGCRPVRRIAHPRTDISSDGLCNHV